MSKEARENGRFVLSNFYNGYSFCRWNTKKDLRHVLGDLLALGEMQNYSIDDVEEIYAGEGTKRVKEKKRHILSMRRRFPNLPTGGFACRFFIAGDEMQNIFFSR